MSPSLKPKSNMGHLTTREEQAMRGLTLFAGRFTTNISDWERIMYASKAENLRKGPWSDEYPQ